MTRSYHTNISTNSTGVLHSALSDALPYRRWVRRWYSPALPIPRPIHLLHIYLSHLASQTQDHSRVPHRAHHCTRLQRARHPSYHRAHKRCFRTKPKPKPTSLRRTSHAHRLRRPLHKRPSKRERGSESLPLHSHYESRVGVPSEWARVRRDIGGGR